jgi:hypothetical protein
MPNCPRIARAATLSMSMPKKIVNVDSPRMMMKTMVPIRPPAVWAARSP